MVVLVCAVFGLTMAHLVLRRLFVPCIKRRLGLEKSTPPPPEHLHHQEEQAGAESLTHALLRVVDSGHSFRIVVLARLTPIPFGLQNGLFAVSFVQLLCYFGKF